VVLTAAIAQNGEWGKVCCQQNARINGSKKWGGTLKQNSHTHTEPVKLRAPRPYTCVTRASGSHASHKPVQSDATPRTRHSARLQTGREGSSCLHSALLASPAVSGSVQQLQWSAHARVLHGHVWTELHTSCPFCTCSFVPQPVWRRPAFKASTPCPSASKVCGGCWPSLILLTTKKRRVREGSLVRCA